MSEPDLYSRFHPDKNLKGRRFLRFKQMQEAGIVGDYATLLDWIKNKDFPPGFKLSHKIRVWDEDDVMAWLETRRAVA